MTNDLLDFLNTLTCSLCNAVVGLDTGHKCPPTLMEECLQMLRALQWCAGDYSGTYANCLCPKCQSLDDCPEAVHSPGCELWALIQKVEKALAP